MPRTKPPKKSDTTGRILCKYCKIHRDPRRFDLHENYCKKIHDHSKKRRHKGSRRKDTVSLTALCATSLSIICFQHEPTPDPFSISPPPSPMQVEIDVNNTADEEHEYCTIPSVVRCSLDLIYELFPIPIVLIPPHKLFLLMRPSTLKDLVVMSNLCAKTSLDATEIAVTGLLPEPLANNLFCRSHVTLKNLKEMEATLESARKYGVRFKTVTISASYNGTKHKITFEYRDPWDWNTRLLEDETLGPHMIFNSVRKYYCEGTEAETFCERIIDEPNTADTWAECESQLPDPDPYPHCALLLHFWLDEGLMTKRLTMHPMVLRGLFLPGNIRNASGNGGGILLGCMYGFPDFGDPSNRSPAENLEYAKFKMKVYQRILRVIFSSLKDRSWSGETLECWDKLVRVFHPDIAICSLDGKEAAYFNACRAALANHPCPKCLVHKCDLHRLMETFKLCTPVTMKAAVRRATKAPTKTEREAILKKNGLHGIDHFLWDFRFSDPYTAYSYDTIHSDDLGKWGHHLWPLLLDVLEGLSGKSTFAEKWPGLKHFNQVTTTHFANGQAFYDILKCSGSLH
ncbi:hypothetical protein C8F04DRAFT_1211531 [Mycena alexandri]|uniref:Transposase n=1 Tax=Mycena alexandri TaxID=1745969 RepID=A0AAD6WZR5_9AGAR|nr:hypothetical protein C8F04DRAFT_1211531 [Mycena alexandri]